MEVGAKYRFYIIQFPLHLEFSPPVLLQEGERGKKKKEVASGDNHSFFFIFSFFPLELQ